ncbi:MAG: isochorismate synthase [Rhodothermus sp.]|nr:isochorismate synthase [Rhodothermus sp.]
MKRLEPSAAEGTMPVCAPEELPRVLGRRIQQVLRAADDDRIVCLRCRIPPIDLLAWLAAQPAPVKFYWADRSGTEAVAALDMVLQYALEAMLAHEALQPLEARLQQAAPEVRFYGGGRFDGWAATASYWQPFGVGRFWLPRFEVRQNASRYWLICNLIPALDRAHETSIIEALAALRWPEVPLTSELPLPIDRRDTPDQTGWIHNVRRALEAFRQGQMEKVVLARQVRYAFGEPLDGLALLQRLQEATPGCFHFYYQPQPGTAFLGASPERLFRRADGYVWSEAVAGTRPRGQTEADDARLAAELLQSEKDRREQYYVQQSIIEELRPLCETLEADAQLSEMTLARGRHLYTGIRGRLRADVSTGALLEALHPTPAVGGYPRAVAMEAIRAWEPFDRGWYTGPIGWMSSRAAEFAVAIRCGLVAKHYLYLYSGAGLVEGSVPEQEWEEIEHKISDFVNVLGLELRRL